MLFVVAIFCTGCKSVTHNFQIVQWMDEWTIKFHIISKQFHTHRCTKQNMVNIIYWETVCKTFRPMLSDRCLSCLSVCPVCDVRALWPNGWTDQDETWHAGRPRPWAHCIRRRPSSPSPKGAQPPIFGPYLLLPNGCVDHDVTWYGARPRPRRLCIRWGPCSLSPKGKRSLEIFGPCLLWPVNIIGVF